MLAFDVGNTHTVLGFFEGKVLKSTWRLSTHPLCTADELRVKIETVLASNGVHLSSVKAVVISSVVPAFTRLLKASLEPVTSAASLEVHVIDSTWPFSFDIQAIPPQQVGPDRLVNAEAVVREYGFPSIVVDSGTATTLCAIGKNSDGRAQYLGGAIIPGIEMSLEALVKKTALLFSVDLIAPKQAIGNNTQDALKSGMMLGYASMIDGMVRRFRKEINPSINAGVSECRDGVGTPPLSPHGSHPGLKAGVSLCSMSPLPTEIPVIATGGISHLMKGLLQELTYFDSELTLKGIAYLYETVGTRK